MSVTEIASRDCVLMVDVKKYVAVMVWCLMEKPAMTATQSTVMSAPMSSRDLLVMMASKMDLKWMWIVVARALIAAPRARRV